MNFVIHSFKTWESWNQNLFTNLQNFVKFWKKSNNSLNIAKSNCTFPGKGRGDRDLILTYLDSPMAEDFPHYCLSFLDLAIFRGKRVVKVGLKVQILGPSLFHENSNPSIFFKQCFCLLEYYFWWEFRQYWTIYGAARAQKFSRKGHFMDAESVRNTLKTFNLTTTNVILTKITTIMYLHESVNQKPLRARNPVFRRNVYKFLDYIKNSHISLKTSLGKFLYKLYENHPK